MKKLLGLISAISLTTASSSLAVACGGDRIENPVLNHDLARQIIARLQGTSVANIDFGDIFNDANITSTVVAMINDLVAKQFSYETTNTLLRNLALQTYPDRDSQGALPETFIESFENSASTIAEDRLFTEYTRSITSGTRLDLSQLVSLYNLNPIADTTVRDVEGNTIAVKAGDTIKIGDKTWGLFIEEGDTILPTIVQLTASESPFTINGAKISAKTALRLRFQDYFNNSLMRSIAENLLTMSFIDSNSFVAQEVEGGYEPFINTNSALFSKSQTWFTSNTTASGREWRTNVRMVWSLKFRNENQTNTAEAIQLFNSLNDKINTSTGELNEGESLIQLMQRVANLMESVGGVYDLDDTNAYDSFFNQQGFKGLTIYENNSSVGTSPIAGEAYESAIKSATRAGIVRNNALPFFTDSNNGNISEFVFVLPIYMIELLGGSDTTGNSTFEIQGADGVGQAINLGPSALNSNRYVEIWNQSNNRQFHSVDVQNLIEQSDAQRNALINQIKYIVSQDSITSTIAKTVLYSRYLDADDIFYAGLYAQIGSYIRNDEEGDE